MFSREAEPIRMFISLSIYICLSGCLSIHPSIHLPILLSRKRQRFFFFKQGIGLYSCSIQFSSVTQSCPTPCDPMNCSKPGLLVHHQLLEFTQTHVHLVVDTIQPSHPLLSPSPPVRNLSHHQGLFQ